MYKAVVISDSKNVTETFASVDLWNNTDFSLIETVQNAEDVKKYKFDIIIAPVKLVLQNKAVNTNKASNKYVPVIYYGRKNFEHIKCAVDNGACGYLSIPLDKTDFDNTLTNAKRLLSVMKNSNSNDFDVYEQRESFIIQLLTGQISLPSHLVSEYTRLGMDVDVNNIEATVIRITIENFNEYLRDVWKYGKDTLYNAVNNFIQKNERDICIVPFNTYNNEIYMFCMKKRDSSGDRYLYSVRNEIYEIMGINLSYSIIKSFNSLFDILDKTNIDILALETGLATGDSVTNTDKYKTISDAKNYITKAFSQEICLDDVAEYVSLSSAYFSRLFKQETGENFIDYLVKIRMENAKKMLENTEYKTYEISEYVGYKKSKYFSKIFKNYTGYTPTEYRTKMKRRYKLQ